MDCGESFRKKNLSQVWWHVPGIPALGEGALSQERSLNFQGHLSLHSLHSFRLGRASPEQGSGGGRGGEAVNIYCRFRLRALEGSAINRYFKPRSSSADLGLEGDSQGTFRGLGHLGSGSSVDSVPTDAIVTNIGQMQESMPVTSTQLSGSPLTKHTCVDGTWKPLEF